jgi:hypothetical protein
VKVGWRFLFNNVSKKFVCTYQLWQVNLHPSLRHPRVQLCLCSSSQLQHSVETFDAALAFLEVRQLMVSPLPHCRCALHMQSGRRRGGGRRESTTGTMRYSKRLFLVLLGCERPTSTMRSRGCERSKVLHHASFVCKRSQGRSARDEQLLRSSHRCLPRKHAGRLKLLKCL